MCEDAAAAGAPLDALLYIQTATRADMHSMYNSIRPRFKDGGRVSFSNLLLNVRGNGSTQKYI